MYNRLCVSHQLHAEPLQAPDMQVVMLGSGVPEYEQQMRAMEHDFQEHFRGWVGFSIPLAHRMIAGCDILLMPSRFEPCGLNQLFAMRYGTVPIAHATGGLRDTIEDYNPFAPGEQCLSIQGLNLHLPAAAPYKGRA